VDPPARIQILDGQAREAGMQIYRVTGLKGGETLYVYAKATSGHLDPLVALLKPGVKPEELGEPLDELVKTLSQDHDPVEVTSRVLERYALAGNDDYEGHYSAAFSAVIPQDGEYQLAVGSSLVRPSAGTFHLIVGIDEPEVLSGIAEDQGPAFVLAEKDVTALERGIVSVTGELNSDQGIRFYNLAGMDRGQTLYAYAESLTGDLKPTLTLYDYSDKPLAFGNFSARETHAALRYGLPRKAERYRLKISNENSTGESGSGNYRLLIGLNAPEVFHGEGEATGRQLLREAIPVGIGIKIDQITGVDQRSENFGVVATLVMRWRDEALAFDPEPLQDRFKVYTGDAFSEEMSRHGLPWPTFSILNQQGNRWVQNRMVVVWPDGDTAYLERFSTTLQAPDFDFRDFPFDVQHFYVRVGLIAPEWLFVLHPIEDYSEVGDKLGEEEWVVTRSATAISEGETLKRPVSQFDFEFSAKRHRLYYFSRILLPLAVIIAVSWILFFLKDYAKRVDAAGANLLLFIAFNFAISHDLPRLGYLTFLDTLLTSGFLVTAVVLILAVYLRRQEMKGREGFVEKIDRYVIMFYPLAYVVTIGAVTLLLR